MAGKLPGSAIQSNTISITQIQTTAVTNIIAQAGPRVSSLIYPGNDTAGNTVGGQTVYINGSGFETNNAIYINGNAVPSKSFISASNLSFTTPALSAGIYPVYVINTDSGATAIFVPGYISSAEPTWVTGSSLSDIGSTDAWSISLSATGDAPVTYALAGGSSLPSGISLAANGLISGTMSSPPANDTQYTFTVVASDAQNQDASRQFTVTVTTGEGVLFANNVLLIHADGTNNQNNHAFLDSSNNNFTITRYGNATQGSFSPFSQTGWSAYFDGTGDYLIIGAANLTASSTGKTPLAVGAGDFTIEGWFNTSNVSSSAAAIFKHYASPGTNDILEIRLVTNTVTVRYRVNGGAEANITSGTITTNQWYHVAFVRNSGVVKGYLNGTEFGSANFTGNLVATTTTTTIGCDQAGTSNFTGYISNFRFVKGTAVYTSAFSPPTASLTNIANTSLLTLQSNRFIDNSNNNFTITRNGDTSIQAFSPFAPTAAYSTANVGGSVYLDGSGDYLSAPDNAVYDFGTGDFALETWLYPTSAGSVRILIGQYSGSDGFSLELTTGNALTLWLEGATKVTSSGSVTANAWNHVAACRSGSTLRLFINGAIDGSVTDTTNVSGATSAVYISSSASSPGAGVFTGYMSGTRIVKGTAVYTGAFTPPTTPPTNIANTALLLNYTNAQIFDQTAKNVLETVGDAKVSTAQYKYGTASMYFDGTGDYLVTQSSALNALGSGDFTIEMWLYPSNTNSAYRAIIASDAYAATTNGWTVYQNGTSIEMYYSSGGSTPNIFTATSALTSSVWQHFALVRSSGTLKAYVNGTQVASVSNSINFVGDKIFIGDNNAGDYFFNGYIDDLRITRGYARYTSNFTPPTSALKDK